MESSNILFWVSVAIAAAFLGWRVFKSWQVRTQLPELMKNGAVIVDVRSRAEFAGGARDGSINIPLDEIEKGISNLNPENPIVLCCASGTRSAMAAAVLKRKGFKTVINAGSWRDTIL